MDIITMLFDKCICTIRTMFLYRNYKLLTVLILLQMELASCSFFGPRFKLPTYHGPIREPPFFTNISACSHVKHRYLADLENKCNFYECTRLGRYKLTKCPSGLSVPRSLREETENGKPSASPVCKQISARCRKSMEQVNTAILGNYTIKRERRCGIDLLWVIDVSCSIPADDRQRVKNFVLNTIDRFKIKGTNFVQVGGVTYDGEIHDIMYLSQTVNKVRTMHRFTSRYVSEPSKCKTATNIALQTIYEFYLDPLNGNRPEFPDILIVMTDGRTYLGKKGDNKKAAAETEQYARLIREEKGVTTFVVGLPNRQTGKFAGQTEWLQMAGTEDRVFLISRFEELKNRVDEITNSACPDDS
ncbi:unnamed protein product [Owenia fusiformis]|uniref:VWFA domain-containing protein n=1 Tax=Owenia fusiformis TaxID=6347 RepID=A0A8S4NBS7_OWEFU|nr:unnamed protein product [Owenia fusiformis]